MKQAGSNFFITKGNIEYTGITPSDVRLILKEEIANTNEISQRIAEKN